MKRLLAALVATLLATGAAAFSRGDIGVGELPPEARDTIALIHRGGPFPYASDGRVFHNREALLPGRPRGYYREGEG